jgi:transposase
MGIGDCPVWFVSSVNRASRRNRCPLARHTAIQSLDLTLYASLELSRSTWLVTSLAPVNDRISKHTIAGNGGALLGLLERARERMQQAIGHPIKIVVI